jgi:hypothetical protein
LSTAFFVDLRRTATPSAREHMGGLSSLALLIGADDGDQVGIIRLMIN